MGKRKKNSRSNNFSNKLSDTVGSAYNEGGYHSIVDTTSRDYIYDEVDQYHDDLNEAPLKEAVNRMHVKRAKKENVLTLGMDSSDEEEQEEPEEDEEEEDSDDEALTPFVADGDIIDEREIKLPSERAWGKDRKMYYGTNVSDQMIRKRATHQHIDEVNEAVELELEAHRDRQRRMQDLLKGYDPDEDLKFMEEAEALRRREEGEGQDLPRSTTDRDGKVVLSFVHSDDVVDTMTKEEKLKLLKKLSPEIFPITRLADRKSEEVKQIFPVLLAVNKGKLQRSKGTSYLESMYHLSHKFILLTKTYQALLLCKGHEAIKTHPIMGLLADYIASFKKTKRHEDYLMAHVREINRCLENNLPIPSLGSESNEEEQSQGKGLKAKKRKFSESVEEKRVTSAELTPPTSGLGVTADSGSGAGAKANSLDPYKMRRLKLLAAMDGKMLPADPAETTLPRVPGGAVDDSGSDSEDDRQAALATRVGTGGELAADERRAIGKVITKNEGLKPHRRKDQKNPRIKYKMKYAEKVKRRKGQVRNVHKEIPVYRGELSGINKYAIKSMKF